MYGERNNKNICKKRLKKKENKIRRFFFFYKKIAQAEKPIV